MTAFTQILRRNWRERARFVEALGWLCVAKVAVKIVPFRFLARILGKQETETEPRVAPEARAVAVQVSWAVQAAARHVPLGFVCLPQALAAWRMCRSRGLPTTLYFGVAANPNDHGQILAHAWLRVGDKIVTGEHREGQYVTVAKFADLRALAAGPQGRSA